MLLLVRVPSHSNRNETRTGRLHCQEVSQVKGPTCEGKTHAWDLELLSLGFVLDHVLLSGDFGFLPFLL